VFGTADPEARRRPGRALWLGAIVGAVLPSLALAAVVAARDPLPASCLDAPASRAAPPGQLLYTTASASEVDLWVARADLTGSRRLLRLTSQARAGATPSASPSAPATPSPTASPSTATAGASPSAAPPSPSSSPSPSPAAAAGPVILAAALAPDGGSALALVGNPPGRPGRVSLQLVSLARGLARGGASEVWGDDHYRAGGPAAQVTWLTSGTALFRAPYAFAKAELIPQFVGVVRLGPPAQLLESAAAAAYDTSLAAQWPETRGLKAPSIVPQLGGRVVGAGQRVAGLRVSRRGVPFGTVSLVEVHAGTLGHSATTLLCATTAAQVSLGPISPDGHLVVLHEGAGALALTLAPPVRQRRLPDARVLDWGAAPVPRASPSPSPSTSPSAP